jgi:hypothetical protein
MSITGYLLPSKKKGGSLARWMLPLAPKGRKESV